MSDLLRKISLSVYDLFMQIEAWYQTDVGLKRDGNQDAIFVDNEMGLYIVADGMGGHRGGEVASAMAIEAAKKVVTEMLQSSERPSPHEIITQAYKQATQDIFARGVKDPSLRGMATTMVLVMRMDRKVFIGNVGDSRAYLIASPGCWQLTEDHSLFNEQLKAGLIRNMNKEDFEGKNIITRSVGFENDVTCDIVEHELQSGEILLLCSDGLSGLISDESLATICLTMRPDKVVDRLILEAKKAGGDDNITVAIVKIKD